MRIRSFAFILIPALLLVGSVRLLAQTDAVACPALVEQALADLGSNCDALDRNSACYGYNRVDATFAQAVAENFFSSPADRTDLATLDTIQTAPLDAAANRWGIAVLNVQANVPNTLPGQAVVFMLMGDAEVTNQVAPEDALQLGEPVAVTALVAANMRSSPSTNANVVGSVPEGTELQADGLSPDGGWLRVLYNNAPAWVSRQVITTEADLSALPTISRESRTPMQAFTFRTGFGQPTCTEQPPSLLLVQGPENVRVDITANGADIQIGSTIVLWLLPGNRMQLIVVNGEARVGNISIPEGFTITTGLNDDGTAPDQTGWEGLRPLTDEELALLQPLELIPPNLLHYPILVPSRADILAFLASLNASLSQGGGTVNGPAARLVDCTTLKPTSPLGGMAFGENTFYWDGAQGATSYRVTVFDENGNQIVSGDTDAPNTNLTLNVLQGSGFSFSWQVSALVNGQVACTTVPVTMFRSPPPTPRPSSSAGTCNFNYVCEPGLGESTASCPFDC